MVLDVRGSLLLRQELSDELPLALGRCLRGIRCAGSLPVRRSAVRLGEAHRDQLLGKQDVAGAALGEDEFGGAIETARFGGADQQPSFDKVGDGGVTLRPVAADRQIASASLGIEFGQRDVNPVDDRDDLSRGGRRVAGGQQRGGHGGQCTAPQSVPRPITV